MTHSTEGVVLCAT